MIPCVLTDLAQWIGRDAEKVMEDGTTDQNQSDDANTLLDKIDIAAKASTKEVTWRRSFIVACMSTVFLYAMVLNRHPLISEILGSIMTITVISYFMSSCIRYHYYRHIDDNIMEAVGFLRNFPHDRQWIRGND